MEPDSDTSNKYEVSCVIVRNGVQDIYQIPIIISTSYGYSIDLVTVLNTTPLLVTFFMVCLCSRHNNEGLFWSLFGVLQKVLPWSCRMYLCMYNMDGNTVGSC